MTPRPTFRFITVFATVLSLALVVCGYFSIRQQIVYRLPSDGVVWVDSAGGVRAWLVTPGAAGERAGIRLGDVLKAVNGTVPASAASVARTVFESGIGSKLAYQLDRNGRQIDASVTVERQQDPHSPRGYLDAVGLIYLFIGAFILFRRWTAPKSLHFYFFCLASFVLYAFHYTGKLNTFDQTVYWLNVAATVLTPAIFLHFCLTFPRPVPLVSRRPWLTAFCYLPGALLLAFHVLAMRAWGAVREALWLADRAEYFHLAALFILGAAVLEHSYRRTRVPLRKQQLKWVTRGTYLAIVPFTLLYAVPYFLGVVPAPWMKLSALTLVFLPITFGYALVRYRLMDVDIIFRRGVAYTLATVLMIGVYFALIGLFADFFRSQVRDLGRGGWILALVVTAIIFQPFVNWIQARLDRFFNPERYDYRRTLLDFARDLTSELHVDRLLNQVVDRLAETLGVERVAVILTSGEQGALTLAAARGFNPPAAPDWSFLSPSRSELAKGYLFFESVRRVPEVSPAAQATIAELDLHYYLPFRIKDRTLGYLGLGKTRQGDYLSSEDVDLLKTIAGYVSIALENARLYGSLEHQALEQRALRDFSESIIESISAGVVSVDFEGKIQSWNSALERLYSLPRSEAVGRSLEEVFPPELLAELRANPDSGEAHSLYKFRLATTDQRELVVNVSATPLVDLAGQAIGRLLIFNDLTERVSLEDQLVQAEKLSSIGLLAAGVAHEVNTPLAVIASQGQMLLRQMPPEEPQSRTLEKIVKQAFRASEIVNSLLKFSRVSGAEYAELDLNKVIQETLSLVEPMLKSAKVSLNLQLDGDLPAVWGNAGKLQQVFMNLIVNARDAMPKGGELTLATERDDGQVRVEVCDTGVGIPPDHLTKIFDPFFTTKSKSRGTGLGLAVSYGIIREHAGKVEVESRQGHGTTFRLELPAARKTVHAV
jgi:two-component system, NtrC family, sensor kinase